MKKRNLFIVGAGRSGTTFLWRILNNSPEVHLCTELHYFSSLYHNGFLKNYRQKYRKHKDLTSQDIYRCLTEMDHFGMYWQKNPYFNKEEVDCFFERKQITEKNIYKFLFEHDLKLSGKAREQIKFIGEKTPLNIFHLPKLIKWFPEAIFIFIYRDPFNVFKSEANKIEKTDFPLGKTHFFYQFFIMLFVLFEWLAASTIALHYKKSMKSRFIIVGYEKLITSKHNTIKSICKVLGINYSEKLIKVRKIGSSFEPGRKVLTPPLYVKPLFKLLKPIFLLLNLKQVAKT
ncbi:sulfotransferase [bacterium]|nr:sulfotransferase [bacterium]